MKNRLADILKEQQKMKLKGNIYHKTQISIAYNSNRIEGSQLSEEQTRYIYETRTIDGVANVDDIIETNNHFRLFNYMLETCEYDLTEEIIKEYHNILKSGTKDSNISWFNVGEYKQLENQVGNTTTSKPENVKENMIELLEYYNSIVNITVDDIIDFHWKFETIHPFQDGNGRVGRIIMFKECLKNNIMPFIIFDEYKMYYYRGLAEYDSEPGYLRDTCLSGQDTYNKWCEKLLSNL
ncbi:MAG: Fic family protein [Coprobacillaceae bacterium]